MISGGASYVGAWLVPQLLADGHKITVYDTLLFGDGWLPLDNENLTIIKGDVRDIEAWTKACKDQDACIYLASISRELVCQQHEAVANAVNVESFAPAVQIAHAQGITRFIYASSVAVYGSSEKPVAEDASREPSTIYGRGKKACEDMMLSSQSSMYKVVTRSASVCGYSTRQRLDLTINRMVHDACRRGKIIVEGGEQIRSHVHIQDLCDFYKLLLTADWRLVDGQAFNVVAQNQKVMESAEIVARITGAPIKRMPRVDDRSYAVDGAKAANLLGFKPSRDVEQAVRELRLKFNSGYWPDSLTNPVYQNLADVQDCSH